MIWILATGNAHKAQEVQAMMGKDVKVLTLKDIGFTGKIVEDGKTFEDNAKIKLSHVACFLESIKNPSWGLPVGLIADDSGLEVDALNGIPGVYSARYAGEGATDEANRKKLLEALKGISGPKRTARFRCVIATTVFDGKRVEIKTFDGACEGKIGFKEKGDGGFGYDSIFFPDGFCRTFAEITSEEKNGVSHRARAMEKFKEWMSSK